MSNRCYLSCTNHNGIYPSFSYQEFTPDEHWIVQGVECLPLIWIPMFVTDDLVSKEFTLEGQTFTETAPVVRRTVALERLENHRSFLNELFEKEGGLEHHITMFAEFISQTDEEFLTIEFQEISWLYEEGELLSRLKNCFAQISANDIKSKESLIHLSPLLPGRRLITLEDAHNGAYEQEDMWNYFRIMGEPYIRDVPWG